MEQNTIKRVDYRTVIKEIWERRKLYYIALPITFVLSCLYIICIPRTFFSETKIAPELEGPSVGGSGNHCSPLR